MFLIISPSFYPSSYYGGPSLTVYNLALALSDLSEINYVKVITTNADKPQKLQFKNGKEVIYNTKFSAFYYKSSSKGNSVSFFWAIIKEFKKAEHIYVVSVFNISTIICLALSAFTKKKVVIAPMGQIDRKMLSLRSGVIKKAWLYLFIKPFLSRIIWHVKSIYEKRCLQEIFKADSIIISFNGIWEKDYQNLNLEKKDFLSSLNIKGYDDYTIISSISRLHYKKGYDILIEAFNELKNEYPYKKIILIIAGPDNGELKSLKALVSQNKIENDVLFLPPLIGECKYHLLSISDFFALPSRGENFGQVYLEALACGTPVLTSINTPWNFVEKKGLGVCVDISVKDTVNGLKKMMLTNYNRAHCTNYAFSNYSWHNIVSSFYSDLLKEDSKN